MIARFVKTIDTRIGVSTMKKLSRRVAIAGTVGLGLCTVGLAQEAQQKFTAIYVTDMHCESCAKKLASKLYTVPGVVQVKANVAKDVAFVIHQKTKDPQPLALWEATEAAEFKIVKLHSPTVVLTEKPKQ